jgi:hypothetical protein
VLFSLDSLLAGCEWRNRYVFDSFFYFDKESFMKKILLTLCVVLLPFAQLAAQTLDLELKKAVDGLGARFNRTIEVRIYPVTIAGTDTPTAFSQYLQGKISNFAANTPPFSVIASASRAVNPSGTADRAVISGSYTRLAASVEVTLNLIAEADSRIMASASFTVPLAELEAEGWSLLPPDAKTEAEVRDKEAALAEIPPDRPVPQAQAAAQPAASGKLVLSAWPHTDSGVFYDGDKLTFSIFADKDCYVMVYHIDSAQKMQLIFPNTADRNNFVKGGTEVRIPQNGSYQFNLEAPFGQDTIIVKAAFKQFPAIDAEMRAPETKATPEAVGQSVRRGLSIQSTAQNAETEPEAATRFTYTVLPPRETRLTVLYAVPADTSRFLNDFRATVTAQGGQLNGGTEQGTFSGPGFSGRYRTEGGDIVFAWTEQFNVARTARTRGASPEKGYRFTFDRPRDMAAAIRTVRAGIQAKGGSFSGDETSGTFSVSKMTGEYRVAAQATVLIIEKPALIPYSLIENEVKKFFGVK